MRNKTLSLLFLTVFINSFSANPLYAEDESSGQTEEPKVDKTVEMSKDINSIKQRVGNLELGIIKLTNAIGKGAGSKSDLVKDINNIESGADHVYMKLLSELSSLRQQIDILKNQVDFLSKR